MPTLTPRCHIRKAPSGQSGPGFWGDPTRVSCVPVYELKAIPPSAPIRGGPGGPGTATSARAPERPRNGLNEAVDPGVRVLDGPKLGGPLQRLLWASS